MSAHEVGKRLVELFNEGRSRDAMETLYDDKIVSIEAMDTPAGPARIEGIDAVRKKTDDWFETHEVHSELATGPFCGNRTDQFVVHYEIDVTNTATHERMQMREVGLYTVANGKVIEESYLYLMA